MPDNQPEPKDWNMKKEVDFSKGVRGKHSSMKLKIIGAVENVWAICVTQADENLIPLKLYKIEISKKSEEVKVINEQGKSTFYPKNWFAPLKVSANTLGLIEKVI